MDAAAEWTRAQHRVIAMADDAGDDAMAVTVPACPDWTARDLLSHMVGFGADLVAGNEADDHNAEWTQRQVDDRRDRDVDALVDEWRSLTDGVCARIRDDGPRPIFDITIHEQDLRGALHAPGGVDTDAFRFVRDDFANRLTDAVRDLPPLELRGRSWRWVSGDADTPAVIVAASDADLARSLVSRRSARQLRSWTVVGDIDPYLDAFAVLGDLPDVDLSE